MNIWIGMGAVALSCAVASGDYLAVTWFRGELWRLDDETGQSTMIGSLGSQWRANSMASTQDGRVFVAAEVNGEDEEFLFEVNPFTGATTQLFSTGLDDIRGMSFAPDGTLYAIRANPTADAFLHAIDIDTQSVSGGTELTAVGFGVNAPRQSLAIDANGVAYVSGPSEPLRRLDLTDGTVTAISPFALSRNMQGLTFNSAGDLIGISVDTDIIASSLWRYDTSTGEPVRFASFDREDFRGVEEIIPAPGGVAVLALGAGWVGARRRRV